MTTNTPTETSATVTGERADLLAALRQHRYLFTVPAQGLTDEQAASTPTASELCIGGLVKHVAQTEAQWAAFMQGDSRAVGSGDDPSAWEEHANSFRMLEGETLDGILARYREVAAATDALVETIDLDSSTELPPAPWFEPGARWTARMVVLHVIAETSQHAGHADILRESIDGQKTMG